MDLFAHCGFIHNSWMWSDTSSSVDKINGLQRLWEMNWIGTYFVSPCWYLNIHSYMFDVSPAILCTLILVMSNQFDFLYNIEVGHWHQNLIKPDSSRISFLSSSKKIRLLCWNGIRLKQSIIKQYIVVPHYNTCIWK